MKISNLTLRQQKSFALVMLSALTLGFSSLALAASESNLVFEGSCGLYNGESRVEIGKFSLDHNAALARECPHATIDFVLPFSSVKHTIYVEHQAVGISVYSGIYISQGGQYVSRASINETPLNSTLSMGASLNAQYSVDCEGILKEKSTQ